MSIYEERLELFCPVSDPAFTVCEDKYRFTVLTERMLRLEYSENGIFEDRATDIAYCRRFARPEYKVYSENGFLNITTGYLHLRWDRKAFSSNGLRIRVGGVTWEYGTKNDGNLSGTARTLDRADGETALDKGLLSRTCGFAVLDDSQTTVFPRGGYPLPLSGEGRTDLYFFGYGHAYEDCIRDFYKLSSPVPLLPRYTLGNWWSRYHQYTSDEYIKLIDSFRERNIPLSVAVIDMDWHITKTPDPEKYGSGWTGYTWNRELIPDPEGFLAELHRRGLHVTLNLHPRDGVRAYEEAYPLLAGALGIDTAEGRPIEFDAANSRFMEMYFDKVLHPIEKQGVDFWWIDWQQSGGSSVPGYNVLRMLNHCHYADSSSEGKRGLILSRYAGAGAHRYPLGFSGDTYVTWKSLDFQPYFTATAANIGFSHWSHDIGGHMGGYRSAELYVRWVQLGVFSPVMRLHSSPNPFNSREPWNYGEEACTIAARFMRLRHRMIPFLYSMMCRCTEEGIPTVRPVYHAYPEDSGAYAFRNEYLFGDCITVAPVTCPRDSVTLLARTELWLPHGIYADVFSNRIYSGGRSLEVYRPLDTMPVFARAGGIITLADADCGESNTENPGALTVTVYGGADGKHTMTEDNGKCAGSLASVHTEFSFVWGKTSELSFTAPAGEGIPETRCWTFRFAAFEKPEAVSVEIDGGNVPAVYDYDCGRHEITVRLCGVRGGSRVRATVRGSGELPHNDTAAWAFEVILRAECGHELKSKLYDIIRKSVSDAEKIREINMICENRSLAGALTEVLCA